LLNHILRGPTHPWGVHTNFVGGKNNTALPGKPEFRKKPPVFGETTNHGRTQTPGVGWVWWKSTRVLSWLGGNFVTTKCGLTHKLKKEKKKFCFYFFKLKNKVKGPTAQHKRGMAWEGVCGVERGGKTNGKNLITNNLPNPSSPKKINQGGFNIFFVPPPCPHPQPQHPQPTHTQKNHQTSKKKKKKKKVPPKACGAPPVKKTRGKWPAESKKNKRVGVAKKGQNNHKTRGKGKQRGGGFKN